MALRRHKLRLRALFAALLWLLIGVTDAAAIRVCAYHRDGPAHGAHDATEDPAASEALGAQGAAVPANTAVDAHAGHTSHGQPVGDLAARGPSADAPSVDALSGDEAAHEVATDASSNDHRCDCRLLSCEGSTSAWAIETSLAVSAPAIAKPDLSAPRFTEARVASAVIPFFQPPSIAPPLS